jgi:lipopolysaccharide transport system ATP-binding protein
MSKDRAVVIRVDGLGKDYRLGAINHGMLYRDIQSWWARKRGLPDPNAALHERNSHSRGSDQMRDGKFLALDDVSFEVRQGDTLGIIGRNGAGKSTLLKLLSRITLPTRGAVQIKGRVASLLEVGTGFHPELTGRENVFLNGSILGMNRNEISEKFDEIVEFSEIGDFIDTPVKRYSSGMFTRLAFAVAAHLDPEILIIDEVLSVGDAAFQKKCLTKIHSMMRGGKTVLFVSHNIGSINELCNRAILLHKGRLIEDGGVSEVIERYADIVAQDKTRAGMQGYHAELVGILSVITTRADGTPDTVFDINDEVIVHVEFEVRAALETLQLTLLFSRNMADVFCANDTDDLEDPLVRREVGKYKATYRIPRRFLKAGSFSITAYLGTLSELLLEVPSAALFAVEELSEDTRNRSYKKERIGSVRSPGTWAVTQAE